MRVWIALFLLVQAVAADDNGRAIKPPMGWRSWNQYLCNVSQADIEATMRALADRSRKVDGSYLSLAELGYTDAGLDDCWQRCGSYGPERYTSHNSTGYPVVNIELFPDMKTMTDLAHSLGLTAGFYGNNCRCKDHCSAPNCFANDVSAALDWGFDSIKLDGCAQEQDVALWAELFNYTIRMKGGTTAGGQPGMMIENCHNGLWKKLPDGNTTKLETPYFDHNNQLVCPFHSYRSSGDIRPIYGSILNNLNTIPALAEQGLSVPGCWAYPDMLEVGITNTQWRDCGPNHNMPCPPLNFTEARTHFGAWSIVSAPLVLGLNLTDDVTVDAHWDIITNKEAIDVNQDWAGFPGSVFAQSSDLTKFDTCSWSKLPGACVFPTTQFWYKPLSKRDSRGSEMAILLINNGNTARDLSFSFSQVPGLVTQGRCALFDVWQKANTNPTHSYGGYTVKQVQSHDSVFLKLYDCT